MSGLQPDARAPRWERRKDARPAEIVDAALDLFVEKGYAATRLDDVAARAGVSKGTLYLYFESKEALFQAVVRETIVPLLAQGSQAIARHAGSRAELLRALFAEWWARFGATRLAGISKVVMAEAGNFPELGAFFQREVVAPGLELYRQVIEAGVASGEFRAVDTDYVVRVMQSPLVLLSIWNQSIGRFCEGVDLDLARFTAAHADLMIAALRAPRAASGPGRTEQAEHRPEPQANWTQPQEVSE